MELNLYHFLKFYPIPNFFYNFPIRDAQMFQQNSCYYYFDYAWELIVVFISCKKQEIKLIFLQTNKKMQEINYSFNH